MSIDQKSSYTFGYNGQTDFQLDINQSDNSLHAVILYYAPLERVFLVDQDSSKYRIIVI